jgi:hypothetical protein
MTQKTDEDLFAVLYDKTAETRARMDAARELAKRGHGPATMERQRTECHRLQAYTSFILRAEWGAQMIDALRKMNPEELKEVEQGLARLTKATPQA